MLVLLRMSYLITTLMCCLILPAAHVGAFDLARLLSIMDSSSSSGEPLIGGDRINNGIFIPRTTNNYDDVSSVGTQNRFDEIDSESTDLSSGDLDLPPQRQLSNQGWTKGVQNAVKAGRLAKEESHTEAQQIRKSQIKDVLLRKLQLEHLPKSNLSLVNLRYPSHLLTAGQNGRMQMDEPQRKDNYHAKLQEMIQFTQRVPEEKAIKIQSNKVDSTMYFPMPFSLTKEGLEKAVLLVYVDTPEGREGLTVTLRVLSNKFSKWIATRSVVLTRGGQWQHIDVTDECKSWLDHEWKNNIGLVAEAELNGVNLVTYTSDLIAANDSLIRLPIMRLELNDKHNPRNRRSLNSDLPLTCDPADNEKRCCRYPFVIDFDELGSDFDFILTPRRYWANYCKGSCPEYMLPLSASVQLPRGGYKTQRCCTPSTVSSVDLVYSTDNNLILKSVIPGMTISGCGCD